MITLLLVRHHLPWAVSPFLRACVGRGAQVDRSGFTQSVGLAVEAMWQSVGPAGWMAGWLHGGGPVWVGVIADH